MIMAEELSPQAAVSAVNASEPEYDAEAQTESSTEEKQYHFSKHGAEYGSAVKLMDLISNSIEHKPKYSADDLAEMAVRPYENDNAERLMQYIKDGYECVKLDGSNDHKKEYKSAHDKLKNAMLVHALSNVDKLDDQETSKLTRQITGHWHFTSGHKLNEKEIEKLADYVVQVNKRAGTANHQLSDKEYREQVVRNLQKMNGNGGQIVMREALHEFIKRKNVNEVAEDLKRMRISNEYQIETQTAQQNLQSEPNMDARVHEPQPAKTDLTTAGDTVPDEEEKRARREAPVPQFTQNVIINYGSNSISVVDQLTNAFAIACVAEGAANAAENSKELEKAMQSCIREDRTFDNAKAFSEFLDRAGIKYDTTKLNKDQTEFKFGDHSLTIPNVSKDKKAFTQTMVDIRDQIMNTAQFKNTTQTQRQQIVDKFASASVNGNKTQKWLAKAASNYLNTVPTVQKQTQAQSQNLAAAMNQSAGQSIKMG